tara:strand:+ start:754 stop:1527 length:774 start_codon:yes stop_codon:yes gene_type:complete
MAKYRGHQTAQLETELATTQQETVAETNQPIDAEEASFKKRYGDLRRHMQSVQNSKDEEIVKLKEQLDAATKQQIRFPKTDEEIDQWSQRYPEVSKIIDTIARKRANEALEIGEKKIQNLEKLEYQIKREKAEDQLKNLHPDFDRIRASNDFHNWVSEQPTWIQDALYKNSTDAVAASRAIDLYKQDKGIRKTKANPSDAAKSVGRTSSSAPSNGRNKFSESMVAKMSDAEYEKNEDAIMDAMRKGTFTYDVSGASR